MKKVCTFKIRKRVSLKGSKIRMSAPHHLAAPRKRPLVVECLSLAMKHKRDQIRLVSLNSSSRRIAPHLSLGTAFKIGYMLRAPKTKKYSISTHSYWVTLNFNNIHHEKHTNTDISQLHTRIHSDIKIFLTNSRKHMFESNHPTPTAKHYLYHYLHTSQ
jgi:hypothetical protein